MGERMSVEAYEAWRKSRMHDGKRNYTTRKEARRIAKILQRDHQKMNEYKCDYCDFWHVGHKPPANRSYARWASIDHAGVTDDELMAAVDRHDEIESATDDELFAALDAADAAG